VDHVETLGADTLVHGHFGEDNSNLTVRLTDIHHIKKGTTLPLAASPEKLHLFDKESGNRIDDCVPELCKIQGVSNEHV
jgi:sn-glycerol 3-phosphate transport system ATP-binding protein